MPIIMKFITEMKPYKKSDATSTYRFYESVWFGFWGRLPGKAKKANERESRVGSAFFGSSFLPNANCTSSSEVLLAAA